MPKRKKVGAKKVMNDPAFSVSYLDAGWSCARSATVSCGTKGELSSTSLLTSLYECDVDVLH